MNPYAEYSSLRDEIRYADEVCVKILGFLLAASASIYGLAFQAEAHRLLIIASALWLIGFFYIAEKRFLIKRVAYYLRTRIETPELKLSWQTWLRDPETDHDAKQHFLHFHPFKLEYSLLLFISVVNSTWVSVIFLQRPDYAGWDFLVTIISLIELLLALLAGLTVVRKYYRYTSRV